MHTDMKKWTRGLLLRFVLQICTEGKNAEREGVRLLNEDNDFILGTLIRTTHRLYTIAEGEERSILLDALFTFFDWAKDAPCGTWGKMSILATLCRMKEGGEIEQLSVDVLEALREKTDIGDFYDKKEHRLLGKAANYLHVAATCAARRVRLGWEEYEVARGIAEQLLATIDGAENEGYLDDQPNEGCYDSYTFMVTKELPMQCEEVGLPVPDYALKNLKSVARAMLQMANAHGDGFIYGRSLSVHGDMSPVSILTAAMQYGLLSEEERELAYAYILSIFDKMRRFWYDEKRDMFNIWLDGRATDGYREIHRLLEVNLGVGEALLSTIDALTELGLWGRAPRVALPSSNVWRAHSFHFLDTKEKQAAAIILRYGDALCMLPLIGAGSLSYFPAYLPFPAIAGVLEAAPQSDAPYLVPEYEKDGKVYRPIQYYTDISVFEEDGKVRVTARGHMARPSRWPDRPQKTDIPFYAEYLFDKDEISARFETPCAFDRIRMQTARALIPADFEVFGFEETYRLPLGEKSTMAPHGAYTELCEHISTAEPAVGWSIRLPEQKVKAVN